MLQQKIVMLSHHFTLKSENFFYNQKNFIQNIDENVYLHRKVVILPKSAILQDSFYFCFLNTKKL